MTIAVEPGLAAPRPQVAAIHVDVSLLDPIAKTIIDIQDYVSQLDVESLGVSNKDGKAKELARDALAKQTHVALDVAANPVKWTVLRWRSFFRKVSRRYLTP